MYAPKSMKQSLAIDFFLFALISQHSICFLERRILKKGREEKKDKNRESFFCINPNNALK
jgi:hypothetical protein